jgi:putative spermidine/putrescine transport system substrate-binding protein
MKKIRSSSRSKSLRIIAAAVVFPLAVGLAACSGSSPASSPGGDNGAKKVTDITLVHGVGTNGAAIAALVKDFEHDTGINVKEIEFGDPDFGPKIRLAQQTGSADFDVALAIPGDVFTLTDTEGVYAPIDTSKFDPKGLAALKKADLIGKRYLVNQDVTALAVYDTKFKADPPKSWADFFDLKKYPGYRGLQSAGFGVPINIEIALLADGVKPDHMYPLDLDRAFAKLDTIKKSVALWDAAPKAIQDVSDGNTAMTFSYSPATLGALKSNANVGVSLLPDAPIARAVGALMQKGPHGPAAGQVFLDWWTKPAVQAKYAALANYGIVLPSQAVYDLIDPKDLTYAPFVPGQEQGHLLDYNYYTKVGKKGLSNLDELVNRWNAWRAS